MFVVKRGNELLAKPAVVGGRVFWDVNPGESLWTFQTHTGARRARNMHATQDEAQVIPLETQ
jgi:hypothetical protein